MEVDALTTSHALSIDTVESADQISMETLAWRAVWRLVSTLTRALVEKVKCSMVSRTPRAVRSFA
jgi:hypothetical protein